jgi:hypothetical protein
MTSHRNSNFRDRFSLSLARWRGHGLLVDVNLLARGICALVVDLVVLVNSELSNIQRRNTYNILLERALALRPTIHVAIVSEELAGEGELGWCAGLLEEVDRARFINVREEVRRGENMGRGADSRERATNIFVSTCEGARGCRTYEVRLKVL